MSEAWRSLLYPKDKWTLNGLKNLLFSNTSEVALRRQGKVLPPRLENRQGSTGSHGSGEQRLTMGTSAGTAQLGLIDGQRRLKIPGRSCCRVIPPFCEFYFWEPHQVLIVNIKNKSPRASCRGGENKSFWNWKLRKRSRETGENNLKSTRGEGKLHYTQGENIGKMATFF